MLVDSEQSALDDDRQRRALTACIQCGYSLRGLPANSRCPECGLEFDEFTEILRPGGGANLTIGYIIGMSALMCYLLLGPIVRMIQAFGVPFAVVVLALVIASIFALTALQRRRRPFIMLAPKGVLYRTPTRGPELVEWNRIERVETPLPTGGFRNERHLYLFVADIEQPYDLSAAVNGVGFADRARGRIMEMRDLRLAQAAKRPPAA